MPIRMICVRFRTDLEKLDYASVQKEQGPPPGKEVAEAIADQLKLRDCNCSPVLDYEGFAWEFEMRKDLKLILNTQIDFENTTPLHFQYLLGVHVIIPVHRMFSRVAKNCRGSKSFVALSEVMHTLFGVTHNEWFDNNPESIIVFVKNRFRATFSGRRP